MTNGRSSKKRLVSFEMRPMKIFHPTPRSQVALGNAHVSATPLPAAFSLVAFAGEPGTIGTAQMKMDGTIVPRPDPTLT